MRQAKGPRNCSDRFRTSPLRTAPLWISLAPDRLGTDLLRADAVARQGQRIRRAPKRKEERQGRRDVCVAESLHRPPSHPFTLPLDVRSMMQICRRGRKLRFTARVPERKRYGSCPSRTGTPSPWEHVRGSGSAPTHASRRTDSGTTSGRCERTRGSSRTCATRRASTPAARSSLPDGGMPLPRSRPRNVDALAVDDAAATRAECRRRAHSKSDERAAAADCRDSRRSGSAACGLALAAP